MLTGTFGTVRDEASGELDSDPPLVRTIQLRSGLEAWKEKEIHRSSVGSNREGSQLLVHAMAPIHRLPKQRPPHFSDY